MLKCYIELLVMAGLPPTFTPFLFENQPETLWLSPNNACFSSSWFPIRSHLMLIACVLIQDVSGFRLDQWSKIHPRQAPCQIRLKTRRATWNPRQGAKTYFAMKSNTYSYTDLRVCMCMLNSIPTVVKERGRGGWNIPLLSLLRLNILKISYNH